MAEEPNEKLFVVCVSNAKHEKLSPLCKDEVAGEVVGNSSLWPITFDCEEPYIKHQPDEGIHRPLMKEDDDPPLQTVVERLLVVQWVDGSIPH